MLFSTINENKWTNILIRLTEKCSSNFFCKLPFLKKNKIYDLSNLENILKFCYDNCNKDFVIWFLWYDLFLLENFESIINSLNKKFNYVFQISLNDIFINYDFIQKYTTDNISFWIQNIIKTPRDLKTTFLAIKQIHEYNLKLNINLILDFKKYNKFINLLKLKI